MKFEVGNIYEMRFITDADLKVNFEIIARTEKSVTIKREFSNKDPKRIKIHLDEQGKEFVYPEGKYSMCPVLKAERLVCYICKGTGQYYGGALIGSVECPDCCCQIEKVVNDSRINN